MRYYILDVFTEERFKGNPLAVVLDADRLSNEAMQAMAREFNLSETTFVLKPSSPGAKFRIRIFTPASELPLAGHPIVGTWYLLASEQLVATSEGWNTFHQEIPAGVLPVEVRVQAGRISQVRMTQAPPQFYEEIEAGPVLDSLHLFPGDMSESLHAQFVSTGMKQLMLPLRAREVLRRIQPNPRELAAILLQRESQLVYAFAEQDGSFYARSFFYAGSSMLEDPATGSAAGALGAFSWKYQGRRTLVVYQGEEMGRGATINVEVSSDGTIVKVGGAATLVARGDIETP